MIRRIIGQQTEAAGEAIRDLVEEAQALELVPSPVKRVEILIWRPSGRFPSLADLEVVVLVTEQEVRRVVLERDDLEWHLPDPEMEPLAYVIANEIKRHRSARLYWLVYRVTDQ